MQANPLWPVTTRFPKLDHDISLDVVVVGGGMAGISCAYHLNKKGHKVALLERAEVGGAASGASSGVLYYGSGTNYAPAVQLFGEGRARTLWNETAKVIDELARVAEVNQIDCGLRRCGSIMVARTEEDVRSIEDEAIQLRDAGIETRILAADEVRSYFPLKSFMAGITYDAVNQVHPARLASGLARIHGPQIYENSPATEWNSGDGGVVLKTPDATVKCAQAVIATNNQPYFGLDSYFDVESSVILASQPTSRVSEAFPEEKILWTMDEKYDIVYPRDDRLVLELYALGEEEAKLNDYYPGLDFKIEQQWGDIWAKPKDWFPIVGKVSKSVAVAIGMGDQGIVMSWLTGKNIADILEGRKSWFSDMASPNRFRVGMP